MARHIPPHPAKGSPEAKAWAAKMQAARKKKAGARKKACVRESGRKLEEEFFGPGGEVQRSFYAGLQKERREHPEKFIAGIPRQNSIGRNDWEREKRYIEAERWKPLGKKNVMAFSRTTGSLFQILQKEAREWRVLYRTFLTAGASPALSLGTYKSLDLALIAANRQANDWARKNPGEAWHKGMEQAAWKYGRESREPLERAMYKGVEVAHRDSATAARRLGMNPRKERTIPPRVRKNPLAVFGLGNPPKRINAGVMGIVYSRCHNIQAEKVHYEPGFYEHPFTKKAGVQILALDSGDLLVHSTRGVNLWEPV